MRDGAAQSSKGASSEVQNDDQQQGTCGTNTSAQNCIKVMRGWIRTLKSQIEGIHSVSFW